MSENVRVYGESKTKKNFQSTRTLVIGAILLALGTVPNTFMRGADLLLPCMFLAIAITNNNKEVLVISLAAGLITALTTGNPIGQIPSILDKLFSGFAFLLVYKALGETRNKKIIYFAIAVAIGTFVSGFVYFESSLLLGKLLGLPKNMSFLQKGILFPITAFVLPTAAFNGFIGGVLCKAQKIKSIV